MSMLDMPKQPSGNVDRFSSRWHLLGAGLSNVWRYGDLELPAGSGRLLLRGPNGTGKTTALEALWPYLLDLNSQRLSAGKARVTTLASLMREGAAGRRRIGYLWLSFGGPDQEVVSFGVRLVYSEGSSPQVVVHPFSIPGAPLHELVLYGPNRESLSAEEFAQSVATAGGTLFATNDDYIRALAVRMFGTETRNLDMLASRIRSVRNPAVLGDVTPSGAADALRESLPGVSEDVLAATAEALTESDATREAFQRDRAAAERLADFARAWRAHVAGVTTDALTDANKQRDRARDLASKSADLRRRAAAAATAHERAKTELASLQRDADDVGQAIAVIVASPEYRTIERADELRRRVAEAEATATSDFEALRRAAAEVTHDTASHGERLDDLIADLEAATAECTKLDPDAARPAEVARTHRPRAVLLVGTHSIDLGPTLSIDGTPDDLSRVAAEWLARATHHESRLNRIELLRQDHRKVTQAEDKATQARRRADSDGEQADGAQREAARASKAAEVVAVELLERCVAWAVTNPDFASADDGAADFGRDQFDELTEAEPVFVLDTVETWIGAVKDRVSARRLEHQHAQRLRLAESTARSAEADDLRAQAARLRSGQVLPLPRPAWAGAGDDTEALGTALEWSDSAPEELRAGIEHGLANSGALAAQVVPDGAVTTAAWQVDPAGPPVTGALSGYVVPDPNHPLGGTISAILDRIRVDRGPVTAETSALAVGTDGSFRAGVLVGVPVPGQVIPAASFIGATSRRRAALAHADVLEAQAIEFDAEAHRAQLAAAALANRIEALRVLANTVPNFGSLRKAENSRFVAAETAARLSEAARRSDQQAADAEADALLRRSEWADAARSLGLPPSDDDLKRLTSELTEMVRTLRRVASQLAGTIRSSLARLLADVGRTDTKAAHLPDLEQAARRSEAYVADLRTTLAEIEVALEATEDELRQRLAVHRARARELEILVPTAVAAERRSADEYTELRINLDTAEAVERDAAPTVQAAVAGVRRLLGVQGVLDALELEEAPTTDDDLLAAVGASVERRETRSRAYVRTLADEARASLAGLWSLDPGVDHPTLDHYALVYQDQTFTPVSAARHAAALAERAEHALKASEEAALRDFLVGRLPAAIAEAWTRVFDWGTEVNRKLRSVAASSGVGVRVQLAEASDLPPQAAYLVEHVCRRAALLSTDELRQAADAIKVLIDAAPGEDMLTKLRRAIDIREWVTVTYKVLRNGSESTWTSRTGLSGGERRLVVLAPMLAAVAAAYDRFAPTALRLAALDEVPAEVDELGREGLARFIAELDLDVICTSYLWDGAPGAWDGVDAHDLEAGEDGTVVAFPMLIRGLENYPGETW